MRIWHSADPTYTGAWIYDYLLRWNQNLGDAKLC